MEMADGLPDLARLKANQAKAMAQKGPPLGVGGPFPGALNGVNCTGGVSRWGKDTISYEADWTPDAASPQFI
jgi:hypothetical protein